MESFDSRESAGMCWSGTARRMSCVMGDMGVERILIPVWRRARVRVMAAVMGDVEQERTEKDSDWSW